MCEPHDVPPLEAPPCWTAGRSCTPAWIDAAAWLAVHPIDLGSGRCGMIMGLPCAVAGFAGHHRRRRRRRRCCSPPTLPSSCHSRPRLNLRQAAQVHGAHVHSCRSWPCTAGLAQLFCTSYTCAAPGGSRVRQECRTAHFTAAGLSCYEDRWASHVRLNNCNYHSIQGSLKPLACRALAVPAPGVLATHGTGRQAAPHLLLHNG